MLIEARGLLKTYAASGDAIVEQPVLNGLDFTLDKSECVALLGASGSGKSTLLHCLGLLDRFQSGNLKIVGQDVGVLDENQRAKFRLDHLGFVFQFHHLIPELSAVENVALPATLRGIRQSQAEQEAAALLAKLGLSGKEKRHIWQLSGGEQARVAIARSLINKPRILLTDEATGNLDRTRSFEILDLLFQIHKEFGTALIAVTHDEELAAKFDKRYRLVAGKLGTA